MFRRKDEGLFDTDPNDPQAAPMQANSASAQDAGSASGTTGSGSATTNSSSATGGASSTTGSASTGGTSSVTPLSSASAHATSPAGSNAGNNPSGMNASLSTPRATGSVPTANAFRPNAQALPGDMTRNRMPEAKPAMPTAAAHTPASTTSADKNKGRRVLTVGNDILLKGEIATCDRLVIEGKVDATLNDVHTVEIAESGSFKGSASIEDAEISGLFEGDLVVRNRLVIYGTGKVRGKITYGEIEIERGGELMGEIKTTNSDTASQSRNTRGAQAKEDKFAA